MLRSLYLLPSCLFGKTTKTLSYLPPALIKTMASDSTEKPGHATGTEFSVAFVTTPNTEVATKMARQLVERKLVACVNIMPGITSIYSWEEKINEDPEVLMIIKTRTSRVEEVIRYVRESHPYSVAEVIAMPITAGNTPYLEWIEKTVPRKTDTA